MFRQLALTIGWIALLGLLGVVQARAGEKTEQKVTVTAGQEFTITLDSNITTGYGWQLAKPLDKTFVKAVKNEYQNPKPAPGKGPVVGAGGQEVWVFKALKAGSTVIDFKYVRPWEKDKEPVKTASFQVVIKDAGKK